MTCSIPSTRTADKNPMTAARLTIVSLNIPKVVGLDWRRDPARMLGSMAADIVLLQEADKRLAPRLPAVPPDTVARIGWTMPDADLATPSIGYHGNGLQRRRGLRIGPIEGMDLAGTEPRSAMLARIEAAFGALTVDDLHLGLRRADRRRQIARVIDAAWWWSRAGAPRNGGARRHSI